MALLDLLSPSLLQESRVDFVLQERHVRRVHQLGKLLGALVHIQNVLCLHHLLDQLCGDRARIRPRLRRHASASLLRESRVSSSAPGRPYSSMRLSTAVLLAPIERISNPSISALLMLT